MAGFLKVLFRNLLQGPSTDPFPLGETFTPERLRGRGEDRPQPVHGLRHVRHVCAAGAINIRKSEDNSGYKITVWQNSCCLCASLPPVLPHQAISITNDWHSAHLASEIYRDDQQPSITNPARLRGPMRPLPLKQAEQHLRQEHCEIDADQIRHLCPKCRRTTWRSRKTRLS